jgi:hypothetical protein
LTRKRILIALAITTVTLGVFLLAIDPSTTGEGRPTIVDFEFAWDQERAAEIRAEWGEDGRDAARLSLWVDFAYLLSYGLFLVLASAATRDLAARRGWRRMTAFGLAAPALAASAAAFDAIEDVGLLLALDGHGGDLAPALAGICASLKFTALAAVIVYLLAGLVLRLTSRSRAAKPDAP